MRKLLLTTLVAVLVAAGVVWSATAAVSPLQVVLDAAEVNWAQVLEPLIPEVEPATLKAEVVGNILTNPNDGGIDESARNACNAAIARPGVIADSCTTGVSFINSDTLHSGLHHLLIQYYEVAPESALAAVLRAAKDTWITNVQRVTGDAPPPVWLAATLGDITTFTTEDTLLKKATGACNALQREPAVVKHSCKISVAVLNEGDPQSGRHRVQIYWLARPAS